MRRLAICVLPLISACYTYAPIEPGNIQPGTGVPLCGQQPYIVPSLPRTVGVTFRKNF